MGDIRGTLTLGARTAAAQATLARIAPRLPVSQAAPPGAQVTMQRASRSDRDHFVPASTAVHAQFHPPTLQPRPRDITAGVWDPNFRAIDPGRLDVPKPLLDKIRGAATVLIVAHTNPDIDAIGSALSLAATMRLLGKKVDVCIDDSLGVNGSKLDKDGVIKRANALGNKSWDLAIVVDVASTNRIGHARDLLDSADDVVVVDHHRPSQESDIIRQHGGYDAAWIDGDLDASALQVTAIASRLLAGRTLSVAEQRSIYLPALAGMWTDTRSGRLASMKAVTPAIFKHGLSVTGVAIAQIEESFSNDLPQKLRDIAADNRYFTAVPHDDIMVIRAPAKAYNYLASQLRAVMPEASDRDVTQILRERADQWLKQGHRSVAVVVELKNGVLVSLRSVDASAREIANALGGNGHDGAAAATVHGQRLDDVIRRVQQLA